MFRLMILVGLALALVCSPCLATTWDLAGNWSTVSNPNGQWSYGRVTSGGVGSPSRMVSYAFAPFPLAGVTTSNSKLQQWRSNGDETAACTYNSDSASQSWLSVGNLPSYKVGAVPADGSGAAVLVARWTCPSSGWYQIGSTFDRIYYAGSTDIHVIKRSGSPAHLFYLPLMGDEVKSFTGLQNLNSGDTVDFCVGNGDGSWVNDGTIVDATVSTTTAAGTVTGTVTASPGGGPLYGTEISAVGTNYYAYAASDGSFSINLPAGTYTLQASASGYNITQVSGVVVTSGNTMTGVNFSMVSWGYITGRVTSAPDSIAMSGATVKRVGGTETTTTGSDGAYSIFITPGTFTIEASKTGFDTVQRTGVIVPSGGTSANNDFSLLAWGRIVGAVRSDIPGNPAISAAKVATTTGGYTGYSGSDGSYLLYAPSGTYSVSVTYSGYVSQQIDGVGVSNGVSTTRNFTLTSSSISGVVRSEATGSPISGAYVRTEGDPAYSALTAGDGSYSITSPGGTYNVLVSAAGYDPQRSPVVTSAGSGKTMTVALRAASSGGSLLNLPAPLGSGEPPLAPRGLGDSFPVSFGDMAAVPSADAPVISHSVDTIKPDESLTITGARFTTRAGADAGTDTTVWVWARTSETGGVLRQAKIWKVTDSTIVATMPDDIPFGMYLIWVENANGVSAPVCMNKTIAEWVGPLGNAVQAGNKKRVFGRNISQNHGLSVSNVFIQPTAGGSFISCPVNTVNPYMVEFTVPLGTANGSYKAFVHNGQGGAYGWSDPLDLVVQPDWVRGTAQQSLTPNGTDDSSAIQTAIDYLTSQPNGGTLNLSSGNYILKSAITIKQGVQIKGAGKDSTFLLVEWTSNPYPGLAVGVNGDNIALTNLTVRSVKGFVAPSMVVGRLTDPEPAGGKYTNFRLTCDEPSPNSYPWFTTGPRTEVSGCELAKMTWVEDDSWLHDSTLKGDFYPWAEAGVQLVNDRHVVERNKFQTDVPPGFGTMTEAQLMQYVWCMRLALMAGAHSYTAYNNSNNVCFLGNKGEMILFHGGSCKWFGEAVATNGLTTTLRTDGLVNGQSVWIDNYAGGGPQMYGSSLVVDGPYWAPTDGNYAVILEGAGKGQMRQVVSHTGNSVTVDRPWLIAPDSTSRMIVAPLYSEHVVYNNQLNAFPVGYDLSTYTASCGISIDGNCWRVVAEGNTSSRTGGGRAIIAQSGAPSYWNEMRDEVGEDINRSGFAVIEYGNPIGPLLIGNACRGGSMEVNGAQTPAGYDCGGTTGGMGDGTVMENIAFTSKRGLWLSGVSGVLPYDRTSSGLWPDGLSLYRNCSVTTIDDPNTPSVPQPVYMTVNDGKQLLVNGTYQSPVSTYVLGTGISSYSTPVALYRVARFSGYAGYPVQSQIVPIVNAGIAAMNWTVTPSDSWITANIQANGTLDAESPLGRLVISANASGMSASRHWGSVTVNTGRGDIKIGVCLDLSSGVPSNQPPTASCTLSASAGTVPVAISFNGSASHDTDGSIQSYAWDFGDGSYGTGVTAAHTYTKTGVYTPVLTVTDDDGATGSSWANIVAAPALVSVSLAGSPTGSIGVNMPVTLTASSTGGYQVMYKLMLKTDTGWNTLRDYGSGNTFTWTPSVSGYYELKVWARSSVSTNAYDVLSNTLSYPVGLIPSGAKLWLKADSGTTLIGSHVSAWADQSGTGNNVTQSNDNNRPTYVDNAINGRPVVRFPGSNQILQAAGQVLSGATPFTTFTVAKLNQLLSSPDLQYLWWNGASSPNTAGYGCFVYPSTPQVLKCGWANTAALSDQNATVVGTLYRLSSRFSGYSDGATGTHEMWINGDQSSPTYRNKSNADLTGGVFSVGNYGPSAGYGLYGDIAEILIYDRWLSDAERISVDSYLTTRWSVPTALTKGRIKDVKALGDGVVVSITSPKVAIAASGVYSDGSIYICESDRTCGMKVTGVGTVSSGDNLTITGTTDTDTATGEKVLRASAVSKATGTELISLGLGGKSVTASGQLVRVWGKVKEKTASCLTIDDGSGVTVKVQIDGLVTSLSAIPNIGDYVSATGPAGLMAGGVTAVRPRSGSDIQVY